MPDQLVVNLFDSNFVGHACSVAGKTPRLMRYERNHKQWDGITIFTDGQMFDPIVDLVESRIKIGWLQEGRALHPENYDRARHVLHKFDAVFTYDQQLLRSDPAYRLCIRGGLWTPRELWGTHPKTKQVSMILSDKQNTEGHRLRHEIARAIAGVDLYGPSYTPIGHDKRLAYQDYRFAIVVEAERSANLFSEHLLDALAFGCVPIYWGCTNVYNWLDAAGMVHFSELGGLVDMICTIDEHYEQFLPHVLVNLDRLTDYEVTEDWMIAQGPLRPFVRALQ